LKHVLIHT